MIILPARDTTQRPQQQRPHNEEPQAMNQQQSRKHVLQHTDGKADITRDDENDASEGPKDATEGPNFSDGSGAGEQSDKHVKEEDSPKEKAEQSKVCLPY